MNIKKISLLLLLSMLLPGAMIYPAQEEKSSESFSNRKRERSDDEGAKLQSNMNEILLNNRFQDAVIIIFKQFYTPLRHGFELLGLDYAAFLETQRYLIPQDADAKMGIDDREFMHEIVVAAEDIIIQAMSIRLIEAFQAAIHEQRDLDSQSLQILKFAQKYRHVFGRVILMDMITKCNELNFLTSALMTGNTTIITLLMEEGTDVNILIKPLKDAFSRAIMNHRDLTPSEQNIFDFIILYKDSLCRDIISNLHEYLVPYRLNLTIKNIGMIEKFILLGVNLSVNLNGQGLGEFTLLMDAAKAGKSEIVEILLLAGVNPNLQNYKGSTALIFATTKGHETVVRMLINAGADINIGDNLGRTALMYASESGHIEMVRMLINAGADINIGDGQRCTALMHASENGHLAIVLMLIEAGAHINMQNISIIRHTPDETALIIAVNYNHIDIAQVLIAAGADLNIKTAFGSTALMYAARGNKVESVNMLIAAGANTVLVDNEGQTAFDMADEEIKAIIQNAIAEKEALQHAADLDSFDFNL